MTLFIHVHIIRFGVVGVELYITAPNPGSPATSVTVSIHENTITGAVVPGTTVALIPTPGQWNEFSFPETVSLISGNTYVIEAQTETMRWGWDDQNNSCYPYGQAYLHGSLANSDQCFRTRVGCTGPDVAPPSPAPSFATPPTPVSTTSLTMTSTVATDDTPPVEYYFWTSPFVTPPGHTGDWQEDTTYVDVSLVPNTSYTYVLRARDSAIPVPNQTGYSIPGTGSTYVETPSGIQDVSIAETSIDVTALGTFTNPTDGDTGLYFSWELLDATPIGNSGWVATVATVTAGGLTAGTTYRFRVISRNRDGQTEPGSEATAEFTTTSSVFEVRGEVYTDCENPLTSGLEGVQVTVDGPGGTFVTTTSGGQGVWQIDGVPSGTYTVTPNLTDCDFCHVTPPDYDCPPDPCNPSCQITVDEAHQAENQNIQFLADCECQYKIGGVIFDACDNPWGSGVGDVLVTVDGDGGIFTTYTSAAYMGHWSIDDVPCGTYTVTPTLGTGAFCDVETLDDCPPDPCNPALSIVVNQENQQANQNIMTLAISALGACCFSPSGCVNMTEPDCSTAGGYWEGLGTECGIDGACAGACCLSSGGCLELIEADCDVIPEADWGGFSTDCTDANESGTADACEEIPGDMNGDGFVTVDDIQPFVLALVDPDAFAAQYPDYDSNSADANGDQDVNGLDVQPFVNTLLTPP